MLEHRLLTALIATLLTLGWAHATPSVEAAGTVTNVIAEGTVDPFEIQRQVSRLFGRYGPPIIENSAASYRIQFITTGLDGKPTETTAQLFVPLLGNPAELPLFAFGSGTTGIADACAPSRELAYPHPLGEYRAYLLAYAGRGFTAIIPDYLGFNDPARYQSYFNAEAEAHVMLDAIRAVDDFFGQRGEIAAGDRPVFVGGYSQGGHAAFATADHMASYAPELSIDGVLGFAATTDVESLLREGPFYSPYIALSYSQDFGRDAFEPADVLAARWLPGLEQTAGKLCVDRVQQYYPFDGKQVFDQDFARSLYGRTLDEDYPAISRTLERNYSGLSGHGLPSLVIQGDHDVIVWSSTQTEFVRRLCRLGSDVLYLRYPGVRHRETRPVAFEESISWMRSLSQQQPPPSSCPLLD